MKISLKGQTECYVMCCSKRRRMLKIYSQGERACVYSFSENKYIQIYTANLLHPSKSFRPKVLAVKKSAIVNVYHPVGMRLPQLFFPFRIKDILQ